MQIDWDYIQAHWDWAGHIIEAIVIAGVVTVLMRPFLKWRIAAISAFAFAAGHFHGREKRDYEISVQMPPPHLEAYYFWQWNWDQTTDFWPTALVCLLAVILLARRGQER